MGAEGRHRLSRAGRGASVFLTDDSKEATELHGRCAG